MAVAATVPMNDDIFVPRTVAVLALHRALGGTPPADLSRLVRAILHSGRCRKSWSAVGRRSGWSVTTWKVTRNSDSNNQRLNLNTLPEPASNSASQKGRHARCKHQSLTCVSFDRGAKPPYIPVTAHSSVVRTLAEQVHPARALIEQPIMVDLTLVSVQTHCFTGTMSADSTSGGGLSCGGGGHGCVCCSWLPAAPGHRIIGKVTHTNCRGICSRTRALLSAA